MQDSNLHITESKISAVANYCNAIHNTKIQNNDSLKRDICDSGRIRTCEPEREQFYRLPALTTCIHYQLLSILCADERNQTSACCFGDNHSLTKLHLQNHTSSRKRRDSNPQAHKTTVFKTVAIPFRHSSVS